jgi:hypothetical protein
MSSLTLIEENAEITANRSFDRLEKESRFRHRKRFPLAARFRKEKVRVIREQLAEGTYNLDERSDAMLDSLLAVFTGPQTVIAHGN